MIALFFNALHSKYNDIFIKNVHPLYSTKEGKTKGVINSVTKRNEKYNQLTLSELFDSL